MKGRRWTPPLVWAGGLLAATSFPNPPVPHVLESSDKLVHFALYWGLGFLLARALLQDRPAWRAAFLGTVIAMVGGAFDEWHQQFIPGRGMDIADWRADALGGAAGAVAAVFFYRYYRRAQLVQEP